MKWLKNILTLLFLVSTIHAFAQSISVEVSEDQVVVGETFMVTYTISGSLDQFTLPEFNGFEVYQSGKSTNVSIVNGKVSKSVSFNIAVRPLNTGDFEIGPAKATINGKQLSSPSFRIKVLGKGAQSSAGSQQQQQANAAPDRIDPPSDNWKNDILLLAEADKKQIYLGEQVTIIYKLLRKLDYQSMEVDKLPVFKGFLSEEMEIPNSQAEGIMTYNGQRYYFQAFRKVALFASQPGVQIIDPLVAKGVILIPEKDPFFGSSFFSTSQPKLVIISSNKLKVEVLPLPNEGKPENFSGLVGQYNIQRSINTASLHQGQSASMRIDVSGWGNLKAITPLAIQMPENIETYEPEILDNPKKNGEIFGGTRSFNYSIVPQRSGQQIIPPYEFVYFDPQKKQYISQALPEIQLNVLSAVQEDMQADASGQNWQSGIRSSLKQQPASPLLPVGIAAFAGLPFLAFAGFLAFRKKKSAEQVKDPVHEWPQLNNLPETQQYSLLAKSFREQLRKVLKTEEETDAAILRSIQDPVIAQRAAYILSSCDRSAYSPLRSESAGDLLQQAKDCLARIRKDKEAGS